MDILLIFIVLLTPGLLLLGALAARTYNQVAQGAITRHFRDAEYILEQGQPPPRWRSRFLRPRRDGTRFLPWRKAPRDRQRLAALIAFFEHTSFVEDEETRAELLRQLRAAGACWHSAAVRSACWHSAAVRSARWEEEP